jgi:hypothetical protein
MMREHEHCDDYINDQTQPACLREFLEYARSPAHGDYLEAAKPRLFATYAGETHRVTMASRFGDVGITRDLDCDYGYERRVLVCELSHFTAEAPTPTDEGKA